MFGHQKNTNGAPVVAQKQDFGSQQAAMQYISRMRAKYRKIDEFTGLPLYKTAANVVLRLNGSSVEMLSNCVC